MVGKSDREWVEAIKAKDSQALIELTQLLVKYCFEYLIRRTDLDLDHAEIKQVARDLTQELVGEIVVLGKIERYQPLGPFRGWLRVCARHKVGQFMRGGAGARNTFAGHPPEDSVPGYSRPVERQVEQAEYIRRVREVFASYLNEKERLVIRDLIHGVPPEETAEKLGVTVGTVYTMRYRARRKLINDFCPSFGKDSASFEFVADQGASGRLLAPLGTLAYRVESQS
ncbi:MAG: RNA polymerase sigma factor [Candidatus Binatia bacterium]